jgi:tripartite-type tricarboxylate transporter receptor subunit TctC
MMNFFHVKRGLSHALLAAMCGLAGTSGFAETPKLTKPVKLVVGYSAGGSTDILARVLAEQLRTTLNQSVVVDNKPGASGTIASLSVKSAQPDGTTLLLQPMAPMVLVPQIYKSHKVDPRRDFVPIAEVASIPVAIAVGPKASTTSLAALATLSKQSPNGGQYAIPGIGGLAHMIGAQMSASGQFKWSPVAYKTSLGYLSELTNGEVICAVDMMPELLPLHQTGKLRLIAVSGPTRSPLLPEVPTFREQGMKEAEALNWFGLFAPAGTSAEMVSYLNQATNAVLQNPETVKKLRALGFEPKRSAPSDLATVVQNDYTRWGATIRSLNLKEE